MHRRWSYRTRLAALIAGVFVLGGATLLGAQMVIVRNLLDDGVVATAANIEGWLVQREPGTSAGIQGSAECEPGQALRVVQDAIKCVEVHDDPAGPLASDGLELRVDVQQYASFSMTELTRLSDGVLAALVPWSVAILSGFAGIAALAAHWLSRRSLGRVKAITAATRTITRDRIDQRLALAGPADEISELGETIDGMLDRLQDSFERQDRFVAGASHELHTPLATTRTLLEIPLHQGRFPAGVQAAVRGALAANARAERLIDVLLTLTRTKAASGAPAAVTAEVSVLAAAAQAALAERTNAIAQRGIEVRWLSEEIPEAAPRSAPDGVVAPDGPSPATASPGSAPRSASPSAAASDAAVSGLLELAVGNLVENAIRHNRDAGAITVRTGAGAGAGWLEISNDGADLTTADLARLTEPFHRGEDSLLAAPGLGLGLALVEAAAHALGGGLTLTARTPAAGGGLTARLQLEGGAGRKHGCDSST